MPANLSISLLNDVEDQALDQCMDLTLAVLDSQLGPDGRAYGDTDVSRADRIARFIDLANRGVLDVLQEMSKPTFDMLIRDYLHDVQASQLIGGNQ